MPVLDSALSLREDTIDPSMYVYGSSPSLDPLLPLSSPTLENSLKMLPTSQTRHGSCIGNDLMVPEEGPATLHVSY
jgi:hypothetical protein